ncbi:Armadillo-type fold [Phytophthora cactorum]|nr:Armadillo-type fold [Phytophthora cactorum]
MNTAINVVQGLAKIFELREAIRHQRRVNRQTYLQLTEIHVELQLLERSGPVPDNAVLRRNATVNKFALAVHNFAQYLQTYNDLNRFIRLFKRSEMENERQLIVAEIDQLFRMLGLATSVTVMDGNASAAKSAAKFLSKLEDVHADVKLTHEQVQAALLQLVEKRKNDEAEKELVAQKPVLKRSSAPAVNNYSVPLIMETLASRQAAEKEQTLLALIRKCVTSNSRVQVYQADGIRTFSRLIREGNSFYTELYALHCLSWFTFIYSKMSDSDFEVLRGCIREAAQPEIQSLLRDLQYGDEQEKEDASILCSCLATRGEGDRLRNAGVLSPLVALLLNGTANQKLWSAESLGTMASNNDENCVAIAREGAIPPLVTLLRSGTDMQKQEAAYALGNLAADNDENRATISREGAIPPLVAFVKAVTDAQNQWAVYALGALSLNNEANRVAIAQEGHSTSCFVASIGHKRSEAVVHLYSGQPRLQRRQPSQDHLEGAIAPLVKLLQTGTDAQKQWSSYALGNLACDNSAIAAAIELDDAILPLVDLVRTGSDAQKQEAPTLWAIWLRIGRDGAIAPLIELLRVGNNDQKHWAAYALGCIAHNSDANRAAIVDEGGLPSLVTLVLSGADEQKAQALRALGNLARADDKNSKKANAAAALRKLASSNDDNCEAIVRDGAIPLLKDW